jgi:excisionase family DNA binding protein
MGENSKVGLDPDIERLGTSSELFTVTEVGAMLRVSKMTIYRLVHAGQLPALRVGGSYRIPQAAVAELLGEPG